MPKARIIRVDFGKDAEADMWKHVEANTEYWLSRTKNFRENTLKRYAKLYKGTPENKTKDTPWPNAANNVIQIIATHCDQLLSRVMAIYLMEPLWSAKILGDLDDQNGERQRSAFEDFMSEMAMAPNKLDFYRIEQSWFSSAIRNGTGIIKMPWQYMVEDQLVFADGIDGSAPHRFETFVKYDGPKPENVPLNKFINNLNFSKLEDSNFKAEIVTLTKYQLEERKELGIYNPKDIDAIIAQPDRTGKAELQRYMESSAGLTETAASSAYQGNEYDIIEAWFSYWHNGKKFSLCAQHHPHSQTKLIAFYNYYPKNMCIYEDARLAYDDDQYLGYGLAEMLEGYQDEISTAHNQRTDAGTLNNTTAFRINKNSKLHSILTFYPGVMVPADEGEIERLDTSNQHATDTNQENLTNAYALARTGIDPATGGTGGGIVNNKRGIYSSQGTFAVMQQQNNRTSLRTSDMRSAHTRAGDKFAKMYSYFGIGADLGSFGKNAEVLKQAFENIKSGKLGLLIRPTSASINKEMEKQNDILLVQLLEKMYAGDAQIIQLLTTQQLPQELKDYYVDVLKAKNQLMDHIMRNFGHDDASRLIPQASFLKENKNAPTARSRVVPGDVQTQGANAATVPDGGVGNSNQLPQ